MHLPLLLSLLSATSVLAADLTPCGFKIAPCRDGYTCIATDPSCPPLRGENCAGHCLPSKPTFTTLTTSKPPKPTATPTSTKPTKPSSTTKAPPRETYQSCGGMRIKPVDCPKGYFCVDDPYVHGCGMACDRPGICVKETSQFCGGFAGFRCEGADAGKMCVDDPRDDCDVARGGADCGGICI